MLRCAFAASLALLTLASPAAIAHQGNPNFRSQVTESSPGVEAEVLSLDDRIQVRAEPGHEVIALGYEDEPYVRFLADGTVEVNQRSPAAYLNEDRFAEVELPPQADPEAPPEWKQVAAHDTYDWHDHRIHYMGEGIPPQVGDESVETHVFDWTVPMLVDGEAAEVSGTLTWVPTPGGPSIVLFAGLGAAVLASFAFLVWRSRRRNGAPAERGDAEEVW